MTIQTNCSLQSLLCLCLSLPAGFLTFPALAQSPPANPQSSPASTQPLPAGTRSLPVNTSSLPADTTLSVAAVQATLYYQAFIGQDAALYNGIAYQQNYRDLEGDPYFETANLKTGSVIYEGITYSHIPMLYDLLHDELVVADKSGQLLLPPPGKIQRFSFDDHSFIRLTMNNTSGFYESLRLGYASLFLRHTKKITEKIEGRDLRRLIDYHRQYVLLLQGRYYPLASGSQLLTLLADKKNQLHEFQRSHRIRFRKSAEKDMEAVIDYYNQLSH